MKTKQLSALVAALFALLSISVSAVEREQNAAVVEETTDQLIIKFREQASRQNGGNANNTRARFEALERVASGQGARVSSWRRHAFGAHTMKLDRARSIDELRALADQLKDRDPDILYIEPDLKMQPMFIPDDARFSEQWHYYESAGGINLPAAWDKSTGSGVIVAVVDTGYRPHRDLAGNIVGGYDFISDVSAANDGNGRDSDARDPGDGCGNPSSWHGTHVAGTVAATTNNGTGVAGVAFNAKVLPVRVLGCGGGYTSDIADGMVWAAGGSVSGVPSNPYPAKVINISLGGFGYSCSSTYQNAINYARSRGTTVVVAAGNSGRNARYTVPANCDGVITVAATNREGGPASYTNYGSVVEIAAPGGGQSAGVLSTVDSGYSSPAGDTYAYYQGTSMATPHVAGVAALMLSRTPSLTPEQLLSSMVANARPLSAYCQGCGAGIIDAAAILNTLPGTDPEPEPDPDPDPEPDPEPEPALTTPAWSGWAGYCQPRNSCRFYYDDYELSWTAVSDASFYKVEISTDGASWSTAYQGSATNIELVSYRDQYNRVSACTDAGCSEPSPVLYAIHR